MVKAEGKEGRKPTRTGVGVLGELVQGNHHIHMYPCAKGMGQAGYFGAASLHLLPLMPPNETQAGVYIYPCPRNSGNRANPRAEMHLPCPKSWSSGVDFKVDQSLGIVEGFCSSPQLFEPS